MTTNQPPTDDHVQLEPDQQYPSTDTQPTATRPRYRRALLAGTATALFAGVLAGCTDEGNGDGNGNGDTEENGGNGNGEMDEDDGEDDSEEMDNDETDDAEDVALLDDEEEPDYEGWFDETPNYEGTVDLRGEDEVVVVVGSGDDGFEFEPPAIMVDPGTTVVWEWTGEGGAHDVTHEDGEFESELLTDEGEEFEYTVEDGDTMIYRYICTPHEAQGMVGAVALDTEGEADEE